MRRGSNDWWSHGGRFRARRRGWLLVALAVATSATPCAASAGETVAARASASGDATAVANATVTPKDATAVDKPPAAVETLCGGCHPVPDPGILPREHWPKQIAKMDWWSEYLVESPLDAGALEEVRRWYREQSPERIALLGPDPRHSPLRFRARPFAGPKGIERPLICNVRIVDLDRDGRADVLVADAEADLVTWIRQRPGGPVESPLASIVDPAKTEVFDDDGDGDLDVLVATLGQIQPTDDLVGSLVLLVGDGRGGFEPRVLLDELPRVADARPADLDGDGDLDYVVAMFGLAKTGGIAWLERRPRGFERHDLIRLAGGVHVPVGDLDGDGDLDIVALIAQEHEQVLALVNDGTGSFEQRELFRADNPLFGSSGIELVDLDQDGDLDVLYSNGDALDFLDWRPKPYHGVQWLENLGALQFTYHDILRFYGAYRATAADLDGDGDLDVVASALFSDWEDRQRRSLIWLENDGRQSFLPHGIANDPIHLATADVGDLDGDGRADIVAGGLTIAGGKIDRFGRVTIWTNLGTDVRRVSDLAAVEARYRQRLTTAPRDAVALRVLGDAAMRRGDAERAIAWFRRALEAEGGRDPGLRHALAVALEETGQFREAYRAYEGVLQLEPGDAAGVRLFDDALHSLARLDLVMGAHERAEGLLRALIESNQNHESAHYTLGQLLLMRGQPEAARREIDAHREVLRKLAALGMDRE